MVQCVLGWKAFVPLAVINSHMLCDFPMFLPENTEAHHVFTTVQNSFSALSAFSKTKPATTTTPKNYFYKCQATEIFSPFLLNILSHIITDLSMTLIAIITEGIGR